jgi:Icc protein
VQISDTHVLADDDEVLLGVNTTASLNAVLDQIKADPVRADLLLVTGDLSQDETAASYVKIADALTRLVVPAYCIPGNHDDRALMAQVYPRGVMRLDKQILVPGWQVILLSSQKPQAVEGYLDAAELAHLEKCLATHPERRAVVVLHHHPIPIGSPWADEIALENAPAFWEVIQRYPQVKVVLFGHVHQQVEGEIHGVRYLSAPSTCFQFKPRQEKFCLEPLTQGYRWLDLFQEGRFETGVVRLAKYVGQFEGAARGGY